MRIPLGLLLVLILPGLAQAQTATQLNTAGFSHYRKQRYAEAIDAFQKAKAKDSKHALSRYNLAATLALMRHKNQTCQFDASIDAVFENLNASIRLDPRRKARALVDSDFVSVARTFRWQQLLGRTLPRDLKAILTGVNWYSRGEGVYGSLHQLTFDARGTFAWTQNAPQPDGNLTKSTLTGSWTLNSDNVTLTLSGSDLKTTASLSAAGELTFSESIPPLTDAKSECEA